MTNENDIDQEKSLSNLFGDDYMRQVADMVSDPSKLKDMMSSMMDLQKHYMSQIDAIKSDIAPEIDTLPDAIDKIKKLCARTYKTVINIEERLGKIEAKLK